jgi:hypothetical protein
MIFDFYEFNFHIWLVFALTFVIIFLNLIIPAIKLSRIFKKRVTHS